MSSWLSWVRLSSGQNLRRSRLDLCFELLKLFVDDVFVVREVGLEPLKRTGVVLGLEVGLELIELLIGHLVGQAHADTHFQRLVDVGQKPTLILGRQAAEPNLLQ